MNKDLGKTLLAKADIIIESWIETIHQNEEDIKSAKNAAYESVRNSIPLVLEAIATLLSRSLTEQPEKLENKALEHGITRAKQGYDITEIVREYSLLRKTIFTVLEPDLLSGSGDEILQSVKLIDSVVDEVISLSLDSYLQMRLQEFEQVRGELSLTNQELKRLVATHQENLSYLAHELKSPLNSIMGFSTLLLKQQQEATQEQDAPSGLQFTEKVIQNSRQLLRLINDTLEISRYEAGKMRLNLDSIDVQPFMQMIIDSLEPYAHQKNLEMILNCDYAPQQVQTDSLRLQQIITNLASNAICYTETGTITITCQVNAKDQWLLIISDTGIGIPPEAQTQIFEPYFRLSTKETDSTNSTGLGLAIVDKFVTLLQGKIDLVSIPKKGSTFTLTFPLVVGY